MIKESVDRHVEPRLLRIRFRSQPENGQPEQSHQESPRPASSQARFARALALPSHRLSLSLLVADARVLGTHSHPPSRPPRLSSSQLTLRLAGDVLPEAARHDAADNNMMVVLQKATEGEWAALEGEPTVAWRPPRPHATHSPSRNT